MNNPYFEVHITECAWHKTWQKFDLLELYCQVVDVAILQGLNPRFHFAVNGILSNGDNHCAIW